MIEAVSVFVRSVAGIVRRWVSAGDGVMNAVHAVNARRIAVFEAILLPASVTLAFVVQAPTAWALAGFILFAACALILLITAVRVWKRPPAAPGSHILRVAAAAVTLGSGVAFTAAGLGTLPFLIACAALGVVVILQPLESLLLYASAFAAQWLALGGSAADGLAPAGAGFLVSLVFWGASVTVIRQKQQIDAQQAKLAEKEKEIRFLECNDPLTNLMNRRKFEELLVGEIARVRRYGHESCLIMLDIDGLKEINERYGHPAGDSVICQAAAALKANVRETDTVARWGGDEFIVLLPCTATPDGKAVAGKLGGILRQKQFDFQDASLRVTAGFGVTGINCWTENALEQTYKDADLALYMAKLRGRDCVAVV